MQTGLTFALTRYSFGEKKGSRITSFFVPIVNLSWYTIQEYATYMDILLQQFFIVDKLEASVALSAVIMGIFSFRNQSNHNPWICCNSGNHFLSLGTSLKEMLWLVWRSNRIHTGRSISLGSEITAIIRNMDSFLQQHVLQTSYVMQNRQKCPVGATLTGAFDW